MNTTVGFLKVNAGKRFGSTVKVVAIPTGQSLLGVKTKPALFSSSVFHVPSIAGVSVSP